RPVPRAPAPPLFPYPPLFRSRPAHRRRPAAGGPRSMRVVNREAAAVYRRLLRYVHPHRYIIAGAAVAAVFYGGGTVLLPLLLGEIGRAHVCTPVTGKCRMPSS